MHRRDSTSTSIPSAKMNSKANSYQVVVSLVKTSLRQADLEAQLLLRLEVVFLAHQTLAADSVRPTTPASAPAAPPRPATLSAEELRPRTPVSAPTTPPILALGSHSEAPQMPLATPHKAQPLLPSYRSPRKMALVLVPPALTKVSQCSQHTRTRVSKS
jgi:hypothetical protein